MTNKGPVSSREKRLDDRKKRTFHEQYPQPKKSRRTRRVTQEGKDTSDSSNEAVLLDHNYCQRLPNNHKGTQTDFPFEDLEVLTSEIDTLKEENARLKAKLTNNKQLKRELFVDDVLKNDESVKFYTGIPSLACLTMIFNLKPFAEKLKYWDKNKEKEVRYQKDSSKKKAWKAKTIDHYGRVHFNFGETQTWAFKQTSLRYIWSIRGIS